MVAWNWGVAWKGVNRFQPGSQGTSNRTCQWIVRAGYGKGINQDWPLVLGLGQLGGGDVSGERKRFG